MVIRFKYLFGAFKIDFEFLRFFNFQFPRFYLHQYANICLNLISIDPRETEKTGMMEIEVVEETNEVKTILM